MQLQKLSRPASKRERQLGIKLFRAVRSLRSWILRDQTLIARQQVLHPLPPSPVKRVGQRKWEARVTALGASTPTCQDRAELQLDGEDTICVHTGLHMQRGRCKKCPYN